VTTLRPLPATRPAVRPRIFYRDHLLGCRPLQMDDGRFQARVVITAMGGSKTRSQRFLDLDIFDSEEAAIERAHQAGIEWIDINDNEP